MDGKLNSLFTQLRESRVEMNEGKKEEEGFNAYVCSGCGKVVSGYLDEESLDACPFCGSDELTEATVKVVRNGEVKKIKKKTGIKKRITPAQKAALVKARKKAHTAAAEKSRQKSLKKGKMAGLHEEELECPECGYVGEADDFEVNEDGNFVCPECGAIVECDSNESMSDVDAMKKMLEEVKAPEFVFEALKEGKKAFVAGYLDVKLGK